MRELASVSISGAHGGWSIFLEEVPVRLEGNRFRSVFPEFPGDLIDAILSVLPTPAKRPLRPARCRACGAELHAAPSPGTLKRRLSIRTLAPIGASFEGPFIHCACGEAHRPPGKTSERELAEALIVAFRNGEIDR